MMYKYGDSFQLAITYMAVAFGGIDAQDLAANIPDSILLLDLLGSQGLGWQFYGMVNTPEGMTDTEIQAAVLQAAHAANQVATLGGFNLNVGRVNPAATTPSQTLPVVDDVVGNAINKAGDSLKQAAAALPNLADITGLMSGATWLILALAAAYVVVQLTPRKA